MHLVIDTNIIVNALKSKGNSKAKQLLTDVLRQKHTVYISSEIFAEYKAVLSRKYLRINPIAAWGWLTVFRTMATMVEPKPSTAEQFEMQDEDDRKFFDLARSVNAKLVTRNIKHYPVHELVTSIDELY